MFTINQLESLSQLPPPLLTAYVRTASVEPSLHGATPEYLAWLKDESRPVAENLSPTEQELFRKQLDRVEEFLRQRQPHERSLVIVAGPAVWEIVSLQREVQNELHWGKPSVTQLLWLASEYKPYGIVAVDHAGARFFHYWLGEMVEYEEKKFAVDVSQWKQGELGHVEGLRHMDSQYAHLCRETAQQAANFCTKKALAAVFLVGPDRLIKPIKAKFPRSFRQTIVLLDQDLARVSLLELQKHLEPQIASWERAHEAELVTAVAGNERVTITGFDETLVHLQKGKIRTLVLTRGLDADLRECVQCGWTDRSADPTCSVCGSKRRTVTLRDALPDLARRHQVEIDVVSGDAAERLNKVEGMGAWLRQPKSASASGRR
ncbi:MAG TPA: hypothetical protein VNE63_02815 [Candidatus Acidoferrales bacterium]|nr:hypothetical protein [Candidatus Acidoferrales bacterium]